MRHLLNIELRRSHAGLACLLLSALSCAMLLDTAASWSARWLELSLSLRFILVVLIPLTAAAAAWRSGRDRRFNMTELTRTTAAPVAQRLLVAVLPIVIVVTSSYVITAAFGALLVLPRASYFSMKDLAVMVIGALGLAAAASLGYATAQIFTSRLMAPALGVVVLVLVYYSAAEASLLEFSPIIPSSRGSGFELPSKFLLSQAVWFSVLTAAGTVLLITKRALTRVAVVAVTAATAIAIAGSASVQDPSALWTPDPAAQASVCSGGVDARVCVMRAHAFALGEVTSLLAPTVERLQEASGQGVAASEDGVTRAEVQVDFAVVVGAVGAGGPRVDADRVYSSTRIRDCIDKRPPPGAVDSYDRANALVLAWASETRVGSAVGDIEYELGLLRQAPVHEQLRKVRETLAVLRSCNSDPLATLL